MVLPAISYWFLVDFPLWMQAYNYLQHKNQIAGLDEEKHMHY